MLFSIIMCTYNSAKTVRYAIDSVLEQTFGEWELLVLDNGSRDETIAILQEYQLRDARIRCFFREYNIGWCKGISECLKVARGEYMMFLGADDYMPHGNVLMDIADEIENLHPDIIWTGVGLATFDGKEFHVHEYKIPEYRLYYGTNKLKEVYEIMQGVIYNSVMHYVNIDFLKRHGIDFFSPFYGDCQGMTEALCRAEKMVMLDKTEYILTANTSQTAPRIGFDYTISTQWNSIKKILKDVDISAEYEKVQYIAERILNNLAAMCEGIALGDPLRDALMNPLERTIEERFFKVEEWISSDTFGEMMSYVNRREFEEYLIGMAGVLYWSYRSRKDMQKSIQEGSKWLARFVDIALQIDEAGQVEWKEMFLKEEQQVLMDVLNSPHNKHHIGVELVRTKNVVI